MPSNRDTRLVQAALEEAVANLDILWDGDAPITRTRCTEAVNVLDPAAIVASQHICLICGRTEPCTETPDACTFDPTPEEIYADNELLRQRIEELERQLKEKP